MGTLTLKRTKARTWMNIFMLLVVIFSGFWQVTNTTDVYAAGGGKIWDEFDVSIEDKGVDVKGSEITDSKSAWKKLLDKYKGLITGIAAIGAVTMVALFIFNFLKLGASASNPAARSTAIAGCIWTGVAAACLGAVAVITGIFYRAL